MDNQLQVILNRLVANYTIKFMKLHNYHWYVKGIHFYGLHTLFEKFYDEASDHLDAIAERILMLDGKPIATLQEVMNLSTIKEASGNETTDQMLQEVINDFVAIEKDLKEGIKLANQNNDDVTNDLLVGILSKIEKHLWMLKTTIK